jgi:hypothetical protein
MIGNLVSFVGSCTHLSSASPPSAPSPRTGTSKDFISPSSINYSLDLPEGWLAEARVMARASLGWPLPQTTYLIRRLPDDRLDNLPEASFGATWRAAESPAMEMTTLAFETLSVSAQSGRHSRYSDFRYPGRYRTSLLSRHRIRQQCGESIKHSLCPLKAA